jgi:hypothetical protein
MLRHRALTANYCRSNQAFWNDVAQQLSTAASALICGCSAGQRTGSRDADRFPGCGYAFRGGIDLLHNLWDGRDLPE